MTMRKLKCLGIFLFHAAAVGAGVYVCARLGLFDTALMKRRIRKKITCVERALESADKFVADL
ncbi:MAG: hypothetical protein VB021_08675 [Oscillospiraceae bacterium]|nr:hypothetical protein [Oscillospiraceae bacterium]